MTPHPNAIEESQIGKVVKQPEYKNMTKTIDDYVEENRPDIEKIVLAELERLVKMQEEKKKSIETNIDKRRELNTVRLCKANIPDLEHELFLYHFFRRRQDSGRAAVHLNSIKNMRGEVTRKTTLGVANHIKQPKLIAEAQKHFSH